MKTNASIMWAFFNLRPEGQKDKTMSDELAEATEQPAVDEQKQEFTPGEIAKYKELRTEAAERRRENKVLAKELAELKAAQEEADTAKLAEQGEYKAIAEKAKERVAELETVAEQNERLTGALTQLLEVQRTGLPDSITSLLDKLDPVEQLEWLAVNKAAVSQPETEPETESEQPPKQPALTPFNPGSGQVRENDAQRVTRLYSQTTGKGVF